LSMSPTHLPRHDGDNIPESCAEYRFRLRGNYRDIRYDTIYRANTRLTYLLIYLQIILEISLSRQLTLMTITQRPTEDLAPWRTDWPS